MATYEYKFESMASDCEKSLTDHLNEHGSTGWRLVAILPIAGIHTCPGSMWYVFERQLT